MDFPSETAFRVNTLLSRYVDIENRIFRFSLRRILPIPGLFKSVDYGMYLQELRRIQTELESVERQFVDWVPTKEQGICESQLSDVLMDYIALLRSTVEHLSSISNQLLLKTQGDHAYDYWHYRNDLKEYKRCVESYVSKGDELNHVFTAYSGSRGNNP